MRGDLALSARLLVSGPRLGGLVAAAAGAVAVGASLRPWYRAVATVRLLDGAGERTVGTLPGLPTLALGWATLVLALAAIAVGTLIASERPPRTASMSLAVAAVGLLAVVALAAWWRPSLRRVVGAEHAALLSAVEGVPVGVDVAFDVRVASGPIWVTVAAVLLGVAATRVARW